MMSDSEIMENINLLKQEVNKIILNIQNIKKQLEMGQISIDLFKPQKERMEDQLRSILKQIADLKDKRSVSPQVIPRKEKIPEITPIEKPPEIKVIEKPPEIKVIEKLPEIKLIENVPEPKTIAKIPEIYSIDIDKEISLAGEARDLMYYFQTEFVDTITNSRVYISATVQDHFIIGMKFPNYPEKPLLKIPPSLLQIFNDNEAIFLARLNTLKNWNPKNPPRLYELIIEIESLLTSHFHTDLQSIEQESQVLMEGIKEDLFKMIESAKKEEKANRLAKVLKLYYSIVEIATYCQESKIVSEYTEKIEKLEKNIYYK